MKFSGHWVYEEEGKVVLELGVFDETDLDPETDWKQAWQNQDPLSLAKGFVVEADAVACAAKLIAKSQGIDLSAAEIAAIQNKPSFYQDEKCRIGTLDELRLFAAALNLRDGLIRSFREDSKVTDTSPAHIVLDEIPL